MFLEEDRKLPTSHDRSPPGYFSCLLSMLAPFVALGKSNFLGPGPHLV